MTKHSNIKLVLFSSKTDDHLRLIIDAIPKSFHNPQISKHHNIDDFSLAVRDILFGHGIVLIVARNKAELKQISQLNERIKDHSIILILDNSLDDLIHEALRFYPRYTSYIKDDYTDINLVLEKMFTNIQNKLKGEENGRRYQCH